MGWQDLVTWPRRPKRGGRGGRHFAGGRRRREATGVEPDYHSFFFPSRQEEGAGAVEFGSLVCGAWSAVMGHVERYCEGCFECLTSLLTIVFCDLATVI